MKRKRGELVPVAEALADLPDPVKLVRGASPQARHHFTQSDQVNQLVGASEANADLGFMARLMALCSLPRTNPGNRLQYKRVNGPYKLIMFSSGETKLPYGNIPRLLLAWVCTEAVRTQSRKLILGASLAEFMRKLDISNDSGGSRGERTRLRNQMDRLFSVSVSLIYKDEHSKQFVTSSIADRGEFWWNPKRPGEPMLWESKIELGEKVLPGDHPPPRAAGHEHPEGPQAVLAGPGSLPVGRLPDLYAHAPATALLAAGVPPVRSRPGTGGRQEYSEQLPHKVPPRAKEDQAGLAGPKLRHGQGCLDSLALNTLRPSGAATSTR